MAREHPGTPTLGRLYSCPVTATSNAPGEYKVSHVTLKKLAKLMCTAAEPGQSPQYSSATTSTPIILTSGKACAMTTHSLRLPVAACQAGIPIYWLPTRQLATAPYVAAPTCRASSAAIKTGDMLQLRLSAKACLLLALLLPAAALADNGEGKVSIYFAAQQAQA